MSYRSNGAKGLRDENEKPILDVFRAAGWHVELLRDATADAMVWMPGHRDPTLVEVKMPKGALSPMQRKMIDEGRAVLLRTVEEAERMLEIVRESQARVDLKG